MVVGVIDRTVDGLGHAAHIGLAGISPAGEWTVGFEKVHVSILGHFEPVDSVDKFTPTENLADETFDRVEGRFALAVGFFRGRDTLLGGEETEVEEGGEDRVKKDGLSLDHGIFPRTKPFESLPNKNF